MCVRLSVCPWPSVTSPFISTFLQNRNRYTLKYHMGTKLDGCTYVCGGADNCSWALDTGAACITGYGAHTAPSTAPHRAQDQSLLPDGALLPQSVAAHCYHRAAEWASPVQKVAKGRSSSSSDRLLEPSYDSMAIIGIPFNTYPHLSDLEAFYSFALLACHRFKVTVATATVGWISF